MLFKRLHRRHRKIIRDVLCAWVTATCFSGIPSTLWALFAGYSPLTSVWAAGHLLVPDLPVGFALLSVAAAVHGTISLFWTVVCAVFLPRPTWLRGMAAGAFIALVDLKLVGRWFPVISTLPFLPQLLDHLAFGCIVGLVLQLRQHQR